MDEYIRREDAMNIVKITSGDYAAAWAAIRRFPAADVAPVVHGRWILDSRDIGRYVCSACGGYDSDCSDYYSLHSVVDQDFCPYCGAKMDGGAEP